MDKLQKAISKYHGTIKVQDPMLVGFHRTARLKTPHTHDEAKKHLPKLMDPGTHASVHIGGEVKHYKMDEHGVIHDHSPKPKPGKMPKKKVTKLLKAISKAQHLLGKDALVKSRGDALCHHASHAQAAKIAGDKDAADKHEFMFLRHALEHARKNPSRFGGITQKLRSTLEHHNNEASDEIGYSNDNPEGHPKLKHHKSKKGFVGHKEDKNFQEDYDQGDGPGRIRKSLTSYERTLSVVERLKKAMTRPDSLLKAKGKVTKMADHVAKLPRTSVDVYHHTPAGTIKQSLEGTHKFVTNQIVKTAGPHLHCVADGSYGGGTKEKVAAHVAKHVKAGASTFHFGSSKQHVLANHHEHEAQMDEHGDDGWDDHHD
jgi:hypothetical protein